MPIVFIADSFLVQANLLWNRDATAVLVVCWYIRNLSSWRQRLLNVGTRSIKPSLYCIGS